MAADESAASPELQLRTEQKPDQITVLGNGKITAGSVDDLENTLRGLIPQTRRIILDLSGIDYIDSSGLGALVALYMHANRSGCVLELANPRQRIRDLFKLIKLSTVFESSGMDYAGN